MKTIGFSEQIESAIRARYPIVYMHTPEEDRVLRALSAMVEGCVPGGKVVTWSSLGGLDGGGPDSRDPVTAIQSILADPAPGFYVMKDLSPFMSDTAVMRALRDAYHMLGEEGRTYIIVVSPVREVPDELSKEVFLTDIPLPTPEEHRAALAELQARYPGKTIPEELHAKIGLTLRGLTLKEAEHVMHGALSGDDVTKENLLSLIFTEKEKALQRFGVLKHVRNTVDLDTVGGLEILCDWVEKRKTLFTQEAVSAGEPVPRGVLIMGISGCGKSLCAKAIANLWEVPLFRLDMNMVFSGLYGNPHAAFQRALTGIESVAPAVLWIDEIENGLGMTSSSSSMEQTLTFSSFLTWMQERPPLIFVAATANHIECLPAEVIRKGRFDEVFFCDLPTEDERRAIVDIHLRKNGIDTTEVPPERLLYTTRGWSGAEIEQAIIATRIEAHHRGEKVCLDDVKEQMRGMVPLSTTMAEQIKAIRDWSYYRARRASKGEGGAVVTQG